MPKDRQQIGGKFYQKLSLFLDVIDLYKHTNLI